MLTADQSKYRWVAFVKSQDDDDLSKYVQSVKFHLHHSFENPMVVVSKYPFALQLSGWGEFTIKMELNLRPPFHGSVIFLNHYLKFHPKDTSKKIYLTKKYDEIFLQNVPKGFGKDEPENEFMVNPDLRFKTLAKDQNDPYRELLDQIDQISEHDMKKTSENLLAALEFVRDEMHKTAKDIGEVERQIKDFLATSAQSATVFKPA